MVMWELTPGSKQKNTKGWVLSQQRILNLPIFSNEAKALLVRDFNFIIDIRQR